MLAVVVVNNVIIIPSVSSNFINGVALNNTSVKIYRAKS